MKLKILHTGDIHIGMRFTRYPDMIRNTLVEARFETLNNLVKTANDEGCHLFVISGDLFDKINMTKGCVNRVTKILNDFNGECVLVVPGNHDYDNGIVELWRNFERENNGKILVLNEKRVYSLREFDLDAFIYPAFCDSKHSSSNNLEWIKKTDISKDVKWHIGIAHGSLENISPDNERKYFYMTQRELEELKVDLWLLGHTHIPYPNKDVEGKWKIFNCGTPEPDGLDCRHKGTSWILTIDENKNINGKLIETGRYRFMDLDYKIEDECDFEKIKNELLMDNPKNKIVRLTLSGRIDEGLFKQKQLFYEGLEEKLAYLMIDDSMLKIKITKDIINREFTLGSFPHELLNELSENEEDEEALQIAYELIREVKA